MDLIIKNNFNLIKNFILYKNFIKYQNNNSYYLKYFDNINTGNIVFIESFYFDTFFLRKQFFLGVCISVERKKSNSNCLLRNTLNGFLVDQKFIIFNNLILNLRKSKKRNINFKKSKLYFINNLPFLFRINKFVLNETYFYINKKKK